MKKRKLIIMAVVVLLIASMTNMFFTDNEIAASDMQVEDETGENTSPESDLNTADNHKEEIAGTEIEENEGNSDNAKDADSKNNPQEVIENFFDDFLDTMLETDGRDYTSEDFATINGYIAAKRLVAVREADKISLGGICAVDLGEVVLNDVVETGDSMEAEVCVNYEYSWGSGTAEETCKVSSLYRVYLEQVGGDYKVIDLDEFDNVEIKMAKDAIKDTEEIEAQYQMIDDYYDRQIQNAKDISGL